MDTAAASPAPESLVSDESEMDKDGSREIVSFRIASQDFCIDIMDIREVRGWTEPTPLPHAPPYVRGLINLRGSVLPIVDLACRLGLDEGTRSTARAVIIVAKIEDQFVGLVVDGVSDILTIQQRDIQPTPSVGSDGTPGYIQGIMAQGDHMIRLLDLSQVIPPRHGEAA